ncbi:MAG: conjugal transfer protein TraX [Clostridia bacterium]|nr:conjugal transfer protein TraX [Clostridia bacterium]
MTIDHIAWMLFPGYPSEIIPIILHTIGRITCPIMCYFIAEGYHYTKNIDKYTGRLFIFAFVSHFAYIFFSENFVDCRSFIPFYYGEILNQTSVMWSLAWGLVMLRVVNSKKINRDITKTLLIILICIISFPSDWSCVASLCILAFGTNRDNFKTQMLWMIFYVAIYSAVYFFSIDKIYGILQMSVVLSIPVLFMYNGKRGKNQTANKIMKWSFYIYYPLHLFIIGLIQHAR